MPATRYVLTFLYLRADTTNLFRSLTPIFVLEVYYPANHANVHDISNTISTNPDIPYVGTKRPDRCRVTICL